MTPPESKKMKSKLIILFIISFTITACGPGNRADEKSQKDTLVAINTNQKNVPVNYTPVVKVPKDQFISKFTFAIDGNGHKQGYSINMSTYDTVAGMVTFYRNDTAIWSTFPIVDMNVHCPIKGRSAIRDYRTAKKSDIYIVSPYNDTSNTIFYEGRFLNNKRVGIHKIYHTNGQLKFEVNWDTHKCKEFDRSGKFMKEGPIRY